MKFVKKIFAKDSQSLHAEKTQEEIEMQMAKGFFDVAVTHKDYENEIQAKFDRFNKRGWYFEKKINLKLAPYDLMAVLCERYPKVIFDNGLKGRTWLNDAVGAGNWDSVCKLLDLGLAIDAYEKPDEVTALGQAIHEGNYEFAELLVGLEANPNIGRLLISSINCEDQSLSIQFVELLVEKAHIDLNLLFDLFGDKNKMFTALDHAGEGEIHDYLREHGAKYARELIDPSRCLHSGTQ